MRALGMDQRPQIELPARGMPLWPKGNWSRITTMTVSFGHGIAVTPLHLASAYAALVNGGIWRPATLQKVAPGQAVPGPPRVQGQHQRADAPVAADDRRRGHRQARPNAPGFRIGGKTGSAEKPGVGGYRRSSLVSTFAAAFPMDRPRYVVIAMLDEPQGTAATSGQRTAAWNTAPVVGRVVPRIGPLLGIMPDARPRRRYLRPRPAGRARGRRMKLRALAGPPAVQLPENADRAVTGFAIDHRKVAPGTVFGAFPGARRQWRGFHSRRDRRPGPWPWSRGPEPGLKARCISPMPSRAAPSRGSLLASMSPCPKPWSR
jgi:hypothetical protein